MVDFNYSNLSDLRIGLKTTFFNALAATPPSEWQEVAMRMGSSSESTVYPFLGETGSVREWLGPRIVEQLGSYRYSIPNREFEKTMSVLRKEVEDDAGGLLAVYGPRAEIMARAVARHPDELVMQQGLARGTALVGYDNQYFFDTDHVSGNSGTQSNLLGSGSPGWYLMDTTKPIKPLIYQVREAPKFESMVDPSNPHVFMTGELLFGARMRDAVGFGLWQTAVKSNAALTETSFLAAKNAMEGFVNDAGVNMGLTPNIIVVPRTLKDVALKLFGIPTIAVTQGSGAAAVPNYLYNWVRVVVSNYLPNGNDL